jgi:hypothetical protein
MTRKLTTLLAATAILSGLTTMTTAFAEESRPSSPPPRAQGTMGDHGGVMGMMGQMSTDQMQQMTRMVDNCNPMMESMSNARQGRTTGRHPTPTSDDHNSGVRLIPSVR